VIVVHIADHSDPVRRAGSEVCSMGLPALGVVSGGWRRRVVRPLTEQVAGLWAGRRRYQTFLVAMSAALLVIGLVSSVAWAVSGDSWTAPVSWRKPAVFGFSFGVTGLALAAIHAALRPRHRLGAATCVGFGLAAAVETAVITAQRWRGVASHFNHATPLDSALFDLMGLAIVVIAVTVVVVTARALGRLTADPSMALAIRAGTLLLLAGQVLGVAILQNGSEKVAADRSAIAQASVFGLAGQMKVPHAVALHAVQVLPVLAWLLSVSPLAERARVRIVAVAAMGYTGLVGVSGLQTFRGMAPLSLDAVADVLAVVSLLLLAAAAVALGWALYRAASGRGVVFGEGEEGVGLG
jgi:hypothetical protein